MLPLSHCHIGSRKDGVKWWRHERKRAWEEKYRRMYPPVVPTPPRHARTRGLRPVRSACFLPKRPRSPGWWWWLPPALHSTAAQPPKGLRPRLQFFFRSSGAAPPKDSTQAVRHGLLKTLDLPHPVLSLRVVLPFTLHPPITGSRFIPLLKSCLSFLSRISETVFPQSTHLRAPFHAIHNLIVLREARRAFSPLFSISLIGDGSTTRLQSAP